MFLTHFLSHRLFLVCLLSLWFAYKSAVMMLLIVSVRVQDSRCMGPGLVSWDFTIPAGVRLLVVLLVVMSPVVSSMPIYDVLLDVYMFCRVPGFARGENEQDILFPSPPPPPPFPPLLPLPHQPILPSLIPTPSTPLHPTPSLLQTPSHYPTTPSSAPPSLSLLSVFPNPR
jgi:hypothetical protein